MNDPIVRHIADLRRGEIAYLPGLYRQWTGPYRVAAVADRADGGFDVTTVARSQMGGPATVTTIRTISRPEAFRGARVVAGQLGPEPKTTRRSARTSGRRRTGRPRPFTANPAAAV